MAATYCAGEASKTTSTGAAASVSASRSSPEGEADAEEGDALVIVPLREERAAAPERRTPSRNASTSDHSGPVNFVATDGDRRESSRGRGEGSKG